MKYYYLHKKKLKFSMSVTNFRLIVGQTSLAFVAFCQISVFASDGRTVCISLDMASQSQTVEFLVNM